MAWLVEFKKAIVADRIDKIQFNSIVSAIFESQRIYNRYHVSLDVL